MLADNSGRMTGKPEVITVTKNAIPNPISKWRGQTLDVSASVSRNLGLPE
jgi:hypothetical protein